MQEGRIARRVDLAGKWTSYLFLIVVAITAYEVVMRYFYGLTVNVPIGDLFTANIVPGLLLSGVYMIYIFVRCQLDPRLGPLAPESERNMPLTRKLVQRKGLILPMVVIAAVLGTIMDWVGICLLTMPIFVPIVRELGYSPIWFGVLFCLNMQVSYLSPPFGPAAFYLNGVAPPDISLNEIFAALWPFIILQLIVLAAVLFYPGIALWLPGLQH